MNLDYSKNYIQQIELKFPYNYEKPSVLTPLFAY